MAMLLLLFPPGVNCLFSKVSELIFSCLAVQAFDIGLCSLSACIYLCLNNFRRTILILMYKILICEIWTLAKAFARSIHIIKQHISSSCFITVKWKEYTYCEQKCLHTIKLRKHYYTQKGFEKAPHSEVERIFSSLVTWNWEGGTILTLSERAHITDQFTLHISRGHRKFFWLDTCWALSSGILIARSLWTWFRTEQWCAGRKSFSASFSVFSTWNGLSGAVTYICMY